MSVKSTNFIVISLADEDFYGFDEYSLPLLIKLVESTCPDFLRSFHTGVIAGYKTTPKKLALVEDLVKHAERLQTSNPKFSTLGIGLAEGELTAEFDWFGRIKEDFGPIGNALLEAERVAHIPGKYHDTLHSLRDRLSTTSAN